MSGSRAISQVFRLPALLTGRGASGAERGAPRVFEAVVTSSERSPTTLRIGKAAPMSIYELTLRVEGDRRKAYELETSRAVRPSGTPPAIGDRVIVHLRGWRRRIVRLEWNPPIALSQQAPIKLALIAPIVIDSDVIEPEPMVLPILDLVEEVDAEILLLTEADIWDEAPDSDAEMDILLLTECAPPA